MDSSENPAEHRLTHRDLDYTPEDGNSYEVIDGELYVTPFPTPAHQRAVSRFVGILEPFARTRELGEVFAGGLKVVLDEPSGVGPDVVFISKARLVGMGEDGFYGSPDLVIEVTSSRPQLDRLVKFHKYARAGVPHFWIADPKARTLEVFRLEGGKYKLVADLEGDAIFQPELFPGLEIDLHTLWWP
ncbi:MAG: Uma2 family endonuclease [Myxococcaceae bacterium]